MKFSGTIGFWEKDVEVTPGVWKPYIVEKPYVGDIMRSYRKFDSSQYQNDDFRLNNQISILSDIYARKNFTSIRYVNWNGVKFKVSTVEINYPRLTLEIGGVYNHEENEDDVTPMPV